MLGAACGTVSATNTLTVLQEAPSKLGACGTFVLGKMPDEEKSDGTVFLIRISKGLVNVSSRSQCASPSTSTVKIAKEKAHEKNKSCLLVFSSLQVCVALCFES